ncbi:lipoate--protein ligase family protein [Effusibacillus lacus]|uniref:Octanoyltransferase n=1 Tax=Effusibacillus lacus TaxID=1348429 RepID=A0A292YLC3_9BACL|nr:biotin/lipoate A/B protein ligase family protein [Effusibacillus lacus]TCS75273.1 lipoate-protein ligase A [Effusibacillus lacus]GAX89711.1 octanoyltransferase [Effusibacillus lacus]
METWRLLPTGKYSPAKNMALDEAVMIAHSRGLVPPTVRFYGWDPPTLSIGYFQRVSEVDFDALAAKGIGFVRRPTGGRAVLHDREVTYSIVITESHPMMPRSVNESYRILSMGLVNGFRNLGLEATMVSLASEADKEKYESLGSSACFDSPSWYELVVEGRKITGSAQTRQHGVILQHGSILLDLDVDLLFSVLYFSSEKLRQRVKASFTDKAVSIRQIAGRDVTFEEAEQAFRRGFETGLNVRLEPGELTDEERALTDELIETKYSTSQWNEKR